MKNLNKLIATGALGATLALGACSSSDHKAAHPSGSSANGAATSQTSSQAPDPTATFKKPVNANMKAVNIDIPSIKLDKPIKSMGLNADGTLAPPKGIVEWYNKTQTPGANGISVIAGHVTYDTPDVFWNLHNVKVGDKVTIKYSDGSTRNFKVIRSKSVSKKVLPTDQTVWGTLQMNSKQLTHRTPSLVLITCDARSRLVGAHHVDNYVVWTIPTD